ncbi:hypothetical protein [Romboutsia sp.]|uniref:hypothetical protein n=1 Tax=Romboutsia sp. TaxID=1965302 RepID=UPI002B721367|nr:hypothetical protein [Romboutsia sp.]HSQ88828.1 hypothetical protein [Romboutsia sp.]
MNVEDFVRVKNEYAFKLHPLLHYGQVVDIGLNGDMKINFDRRYNHDSFEWVECKMYEVISDKKHISSTKMRMR